MAREFGIQKADIQDCPAAHEAWTFLEEFLGQAPVVALDGTSLGSWARVMGGDGDRLVLGLDQLALLLVPGRLATRRADLLQVLLPSGQCTHKGPRGNTPEALVGALAELMGRFLDQDAGSVALALGGLTRALHGLRLTDAQAARQLEFALDLLDRPSVWALSTGGLFNRPSSLRDGCLADTPQADADLSSLLADLPPAAAATPHAWRRHEELPTAGPACTPSHPSDEARLDELFEVHLPALLAAEQGGQPEDYYRQSQHEVARQVAQTLGRDELLLVHAPTGTGKTLAYLLPAMLWARRHKVRVAIATYTRALQEQAMDREVPRARSALARSGDVDETRVSVLKGRENYLCFRSLKMAVPDADGDAAAWLAWTSLVLFGLTDPDGDLDRFPRRPALRMESDTRMRTAAGHLLHAVRARSGCCSGAQDKDTCCATLAVRKAARSHVVLTNQALALARPEMFRYVIFDECEHLHSVARSAWSHEVGFASMRETLLRLHRPGKGRSSRPLDVLGRKLPPGGGARKELQQSRQHWDTATRCLHALEEEASAFDRWRCDAERSRPAREHHALFREYVQGEGGQSLLAARLETTGAINRLESSLERLLETVGALDLTGFGLMRRNVELVRADLGELMEQLCAWLPEKDGQPALSQHVFHDITRQDDGALELSAQLLLPDEQLGRAYYPSLACGVFLSATTCLANGFAPAMAYLGLDRTQEPSPDGDQPGRKVRTFSAPEVFDYSRVLVGLPRDVPAPQNREAHRGYVREVIDWLGTRTRGRMLVLFTSLADVRAVGEALAPLFAQRQIPLWYQGMPGIGKEELADLFRERTDSILLGVDTFWYGADFPGETLEYLVIARLPYGVPDRYHHAQCAAIGEKDQRKRVYMPRALAKMRQGFGRLMRRTGDRGCVLILDPRICGPRHRMFLRELPVAANPMVTGEELEGLARLVRGDSRQVLHECLAHMDMLADVQRRQLGADFEPSVPVSMIPTTPAPPAPPAPGVQPVQETRQSVDIPIDDLPF
jgi:ATP-dependent DNA helicase DinG